MNHLRVLNLRYKAPIIIGLMVVGFLSAAHEAKAEIINSFESIISLSKDGSFVVTERIEYDFRNEDRHGIFRDIPTSHPQSASVWYKERYIDVEPTAVLRDGAPELFTINQNGDTVQIKIGDPDLTITDTHEYTITYKVSGALFQQEDGGVEIYWNATGHGWKVPIRRFKAVIEDPEGLFGTGRFCYRGFKGATDSCEKVYATSSTVVFEERNLAPGEGVTIAQALVASKTSVNNLERTIVWLPWLLGGVLWFLILIFGVYRLKTTHKPDVPIVSQYEPLPDFKPMFTGVLFDSSLDARDITAGIMYLAEQGFIHIKRTEEKVFWLFETADFEITLRRSPGEVESEFLAEVLSLFFSGEVDVAVGSSMKLSNLKLNQTKRLENSRTIQKLQQTVVTDLIDRGYFERVISPVILVGLAALGGALLVIVVVVFDYKFDLFIVGFGIIFLITLAILAFILKRRTKKGYEALNHLKGFKDFLAATEKERYKFHNSPQSNPQLFMSFLPYAVAFGVEEEWANVFKDITIPNPAWYEDQSINTFSALSLTRDLGAFSSSFSQSSGTSGSSGGGSSGGGAGGGGGGSW